MDFEKELAELINKYSKENDSNTPDFIMAQYMKECLDAFAKASRARENWYGKRLSILSASEPWPEFPIKKEAGHE